MTLPVVEKSLSLPKVVYVETTNRCNLRCRGCIQYRGIWEAERDMSLEELVMITDQLPALERAVLHGIGEPLLNPALPGMIRHLKKRKTYVLFNSNGILLDEHRRQALVDAGLDELRISLDASSADGYRAIRNSDAFERILGNLRGFTESLARSRQRVPKLSLWFLGTRENIGELPGIITIAGDIGIPEVYLQRLVYFQDGEGYGVALRKNTLMAAEEEADNLVGESMALAERLGVALKASGLSNPSASLTKESVTSAPWRKCFRPTTLTYITANGNVLPCCISPFATIDYSSILLGNVFATPLAEIWHGSRYQRFRQQRQSGTPPVCCQGCGVCWSL